MININDCYLINIFILFINCDTHIKSIELKIFYFGLNIQSCNDNTLKVKKN